jgi:hypothetical protein
MKIRLEAAALIWALSYSGHAFVPAPLRLQNRRATTTEVANYLDSLNKQPEKDDNSNKKPPSSYSGLRYTPPGKGVSNESGAENGGFASKPLDETTAINNVVGSNSIESSIPVASAPESIASGASADSTYSDDGRTALSNPAIFQWEDDAKEIVQQRDNPSVNEATEDEDRTWRIPPLANGKLQYENCEPANPVAEVQEKRFVPAGSMPKPAGPSRRTAIINTKGMTERIMTRTAAEAQASGAGGVSTWAAFQRVEENWSRLKKMKPLSAAERARGGKSPSPQQQQFVTQDGAMGDPRCWSALHEVSLGSRKLDYDVVVCGGTLGIFFATALQLKGHKVCVLEAGQLRGREQEWNISMEELLELVNLGVLTMKDINAAVQTEFPACRSGFKVSFVDFYVALCQSLTYS